MSEGKHYAGAQNNHKQKSRISAAKVLRYTTSSMICNLLCSFKSNIILHLLMCLISFNVNILSRKNHKPI